MLTLETAVDNLDVNVCPLIKDATFMSTPNLAKDPATTPTGSTPTAVIGPTASPAVIAPQSTASSSSAAGAGVGTRMVIGGGHGGGAGNALLSSPYTHIRSTSYNLAALSRKAIVSSPPILENKGTPSYVRNCSFVSFNSFKDSNTLRWLK